MEFSERMLLSYAGNAIGIAFVKVLPRKSDTFTNSK